MLKSLKTTRKRLAEKLSGTVSSSSCGSCSSNDEPLSRQPSVAHEYVHQSRGHVKAHGDAVPRIFWSSAGYQARTPFGDINVLQADKQHILAAVMSCQPSAQGGRYLQRMLAKELQAHIRHLGGDVRAAIPAALRALDHAFRALHPFNGPVLDGVALSLAYADLRSQEIHTASNGGCRIVVGRRESGGNMHVVVDVGSSSSMEEAYREEPKQASSNSKAAAETHDPLRDVNFATVQLKPGIDTVILGSQGLWREVPGQKALLRLQHYHEEAPTANGGNAATHLTNFALHAVAERSSRQADPRMRSLKSVGHLQSLWTGDRSIYKWGRRQPVRRRRGDVHGDLSAIVLRIEWPGASSSETAACRKGGLTSLLSHHKRPCAAPVSERAARHWDLLRMHFLHYQLASRRMTQQKWAELVADAVERAAELRHRRQAAEILLRRGLFGHGGFPTVAGGSPPASRAGSLYHHPGGWRPAGWETLAAETLGNHEHPVSKGSDSAEKQMGQPLVSNNASPSLSEAPTSSSLGQPLEPSPAGSMAPSAFSSLSSASSSDAWQPPALPQQQQRPSAPGAIGRTLSRRNLFVPQPQHESLPGVSESFENPPEAPTARALKELQALQVDDGSKAALAAQGSPAQSIKQEWQAYELHRASQGLNLDGNPISKAE